MNFGKKKQVSPAKPVRIEFEETEPVRMLPEREYQQSLDQIEEQEREIEAKRQQIDAQKRRIEEQERQIEALQQRCGEIGQITAQRDEAFARAAALQEEKEALEDELNNERESVQRYAALNENLLRINRERANAARGLQPKKEHTGYAVLSSNEYLQRYKDDYKNWKELLLWETRMQSPWSTDMPAAEVRELIEEELYKSIGGALGLEYRYPGDGFEKLAADREWKEEREKSNVVFSVHLCADYRAGYWESVLRHTKPLSAVPEEMQPKKKNAPKNGAGK